AAEIPLHLALLFRRRHPAVYAWTEITGTEPECSPASGKIIRESEALRQFAFPAAQCRLHCVLLPRRLRPVLSLQGTLHGHIPRKSALGCCGAVSKNRPHLERPRCPCADSQASGEHVLPAIRRSFLAAGAESQPASRFRRYKVSHRHAVRIKKLPDACS